MRADIALGDGAENGVGQGMQGDIGIGMAGEAVVVRDPDAVQPYMVARAGGMHVEAVAGAHIAQRRERRGEGLASIEVRVGRQLHVRCLAFEDMQRLAGPFGHRAVIREIGDARRRCALVRVEDVGEAKRLRRLHRPEIRPRRRRHHQPRLVDALDRVRHGQAGHRRAVPGRSVDRPVDEPRRGKRAGGVVDQHDVRLKGGQRPEPGEAGGLTRGTAAGRRHHPVDGTNRLGIEALVAVADHDEGGGDTGMRREQAERAAQDGHPGDRSILLRHRPAGAQTPAGCNDDRGDQRISSLLRIHPELPRHAHTGWGCCRHL